MNVSLTRALSLASALVLFGAVTAFAGTSSTSSVLHGGAARTATTASATGWSGVGFGFDGAVFDMALFNGSVYAVGAFTSACLDVNCASHSGRLNHVARWNGSAWKPVGFGFDSSVYAIAVYNNELYVGGPFENRCDQADCGATTRVAFIARWAAGAWQPLAFGLEDDVSDLAPSPNGLLVAGDFFGICSDAACSGYTESQGIARWAGSWTAIGGIGVGFSPRIAVASGDVYLGVTGIHGHVYKWNGAAPAQYTDWPNVGHGFDDDVLSLAVFNGQLVAGGAFIDACGNDGCTSGNARVNHLARWDATTSTWRPVGHGVSDTVVSLLVMGAALYASGSFDKTCDNTACSTTTTVNRIAKWTGSAWQRLGYGIDVGSSQFGSRLLANNGVLYASPVWICPDLACTFSNVAIVHYAARYTPPATCSDKPAVPTLATPAGGTTVGSLRPTLAWHAAKCAKSYSVVVRNGSGAVVDSKAGITALQYRTNPLGAHRTFTWKVNACNSHGCTASASRTFKTP